MHSTDWVIARWAESFELTQETLRFLREEGFTSINLLRRLMPEEIEKSLQLPRRLPLAQCLALKEAVTKLVEDIVPMKLMQKVSEKSYETTTYPLAQNTQMTCTMQGKTEKINSNISSISRTVHELQEKKNLLISAVRHM